MGELREETIPLISRKNRLQPDQGYGSENSRKETHATKPSFKDLFGTATRVDKSLIGLALGITLLAACCYPILFLSTQLGIAGAGPFEELMRQLPLENLSLENQTALDEAGERYISIVLLSLILVTCIALLLMVLKFVGMFIFGLVAVRITRRLRYKYVSHVLRMDMAESLDKSTGELIAMLDQNIIKISDALESNLPLAIEVVAQLVANFAMVFFIRWDLALIMLSFVIPAGILFYFGTKSYVNMIDVEQGCLAKAAQIANEFLVCIKTVICFNGQQRTIDTYNKTITEAMQLSNNRRGRTAIVDASKILIMDVVCILVVAYGAATLDDTEPFMLATILVLSINLSVMITFFNMHVNAIFVAMVSAHQINQILAIRPEIEIPGVGESPSEIGPRISFKNVSFFYPSRPDVEVLNDFDLEISPRQRIGIVGESGCGKSTIVALLMRFFDPTNGVITIDGNPITSLDVDWLRNQFGFVTQEPVLFDMSIYDNVKCSNDDATHDEIIEAIHQANAMEFITQMEEGFSTRVGERGSQLSGGQKQRVAIARALLRKPAILVLDEATSSLDTQSEALVQAAIDKVSKSYTTITIAHRLSTIMNVDYVIVMDQGRICESGPPSELINKRTTFYRMLQQQSITADEGGTFSQSDSSGTEMKANRKKLRRRPRARYSSTDSHRSSVDVDMFGVNESNKIVETQEHLIGDTKNLNTKASLINLMSLHPKSRSSLCLSLFASGIRASRGVAVLILISMSIEALTYQRDLMMKKIYEIVAYFGALVIIFFLSELVLMRAVGQYADEVTAKIRTSLVTHFLKQNLSYFDMKCHESGTLSALLATHTANIRETLASKLPEFLTALVMSVEAMAVGLIFNAPLFLAAASLSAIVTVLRAIESRGLLKEQKKLVPLQLEAARLASEAFTNIETVKAYCLETYFSQSYKDKYVAVEKQKIRQILVNSFLIGSGAVFPTLCYQLTWLIAAYMMVANQNASIIDVYITAWVSTMVYQRLMLVLTQVAMITRGLASCTTIANVLQEQTIMNNLTKTGLTPVISYHT